MKTGPSTGPDLSGFLPYSTATFLSLFPGACLGTLNPILLFSQLMFLGPVPVPKYGAFLGLPVTLNLPLFSQ